MYSVHSDDFQSISLFYKIIWPVKSAIGFVSWNNFVYNLAIRHLDDPANFRSIGPTSFAVHIQSCNENEYYVFLLFWSVKLTTYVDSWENFVYSITIGPLDDFVNLSSIGSASFAVHFLSDI